MFFLPILAGCITLIYQTGFSWIEDLHALPLYQVSGLDGKYLYGLELPAHSREQL